MIYDASFPSLHDPVPNLIERVIASAGSHCDSRGALARPAGKEVCLPSVQ